MKSTKSLPRDMPQAKRAMKIVMFKVWLVEFAVMAVVSFLLLLLPKTSDFHMDDATQLPVLWIMVGFVLIWPALYIGRRRWLIQDAKNFWGNPVVVADRIEQWASARGSAAGPILLSPLFWSRMWQYYWDERTTAVEAIQHGGGEKTEHEANLPKSYSSTEGEKAFFGAVLQRSNSFYRPLKWYEIVVATILILIAIPLVAYVFGPLGDFVSKVQMNHNITH